MLGLLHVLRATDCHYENLVAHGPHLVLIDGETLMVPDVDPAGDGSLSSSNESFWQSVVRTGLLPHWETRADPSVPCDISALGGIAPQATPSAVPQWKDINTDDMDVFHQSVTLPRQRNAAMLDGVAASPGDHVEDVVAGFSEMYRLLLRHRSALLAADGPLAGFRTQPVRYVFRATEQYGQILRRSLAPESLRNGCDRSIELDHLSRGLAAEPRRTRLWALVPAERVALEELDIPRFDVRADETTLRHGGQAVAPGLFRTSGYRKVVERLESLSEGDLALQTRIVEMSLHAWRARSEKHFDAGLGRDGHRAGAPRVVTRLDRRGEFLSRAKAIAADIASRAVRDPDGSLSWIGLTHFPGIGRYQVLPVDDGLYGGRCGIALFLAACDHVSQSEDHRQVIDAALQPLHALLRDSSRSRLEHHARTIGLGMAEGVGGLVYALTCIAGWWQDPALVDEAELLAATTTREALEADRRFDVIGGAAGAILGLMALYRRHASSRTLRILEDCAEWLCRHQRSEGEDAGGWEAAFAARSLTGFSHGASGIATALAQVYSVTRDPKLLSAVLAALQFERRAFLPSMGNWIDFRRHEPGMPPSCVTSWCHGAPGIGMARLMMRPTVQHPLLGPDLDAALATTQVPRPHAVDHLCCGTAGRIDILLHAARTLGRPDLSDVATDQAWDMMCRPEGVRLFPSDVPDVRNPGLFDGVAGVGYALLRLAVRDALPCVLAWE